MSRRRLLRISRTFWALVGLLLTGSLGCWEQWSEDWFPQMKWQKTVQAFEDVDFRGQHQGFSPPEGTVPITGGEAPVSNVVDAASDHLVNPRPMSLESLENGRTNFERYCVACHGESGMGDGPVSMAGPQQGPFAGVLPLVVAGARSDGHVYTTIRYGRRRMPSYSRIPSNDRWDIVNYVRYLIKQRGVN